MMNENVNKSYDELVEIRNGLKNSENQATIEGYMKRLDDCLIYLQTEDEYAGWAASLRKSIELINSRADRFNDENKKDALEYIITYVEKLAELIEVKSAQEPEETTFSSMCEEAKAVCEDIASTVQMGYQATKDAIKAEGPQYVAKARDSIRGMSDKIKTGVRTWLKEDDNEE